MYKLTKEQAKEIEGFEYQDQCIIMPIIDGGGNIIISEELCNDLVLETFKWVKELQQVEFIEPKTDK